MSTTFVGRCKGGPKLTTWYELEAGDLICLETPGHDFVAVYITGRAHASVGPGMPAGSAVGILLTPVEGVLDLALINLSIFDVWHRFTPRN